MKTLFELERHRKVVVGDRRALTAWTPRFMPGCCNRRAHQLRPSPAPSNPRYAPPGPIEEQPRFAPA